MDPALWQYFVAGATGFLTWNMNMNPQAGLASGTKVRYHSMAWKTSEQETRVCQLAAATPVGGVLRFLEDIRWEVATPSLREFHR